MEDSLEREQRRSASPFEGKDGGNQISEAQRERMHRNREKAKAIRQARRATAPYDLGKSTHTRKSSSSASGSGNSYTALRVADSRPLSASLRDTHGGFMLEEDDTSRKRGGRLVEEEAPPLPGEWEVCDECGRRFAESFLLSKFDLNVCDLCRDRDGKHKLITKTEAKQRFLLKDGDFEERDGPPLRYLLRKNPHDSWGDMKLYLTSQVQSRSLTIWGGDEGLESERCRRGEAREKKKEKKYAKEIKDLRRAVRLSRTQSLSSSSHEHTFTPSGESYDSDTDTWTKTCSECGYQVTFEKM